MRWKLTPLDGSLDLVQITDETDTILGCLSIDAFDRPGSENNDLHAKLWNGWEVEVELVHVATGDLVKERE